MLEVAGELTNFVKAISRVPGMEFLAEAAQDRADSNDDFSAVDNEGKRHPYERQLYVVASDSQAWRELLSLWDRFQRGEDMPYGKAPFKHLFSRLDNLRAWNDADRLERTGALQVWREELADLGDELIEFEIELWHRRDTAKRSQGAAELRADIDAKGGTTIAESIRPEIAYHGLLAKVPARYLREAVENHEVRWLRTVSVRFFHAVGQLASDSSADTPSGQADIAFSQRARPTRTEPRLAVLDGVPLAGHEALKGRIVVDDPEGWEQVTPAARRRHGTALASLVIHGDLGAPGAPQSAPVYLRPILWDQTPDWVRAGREELPRDRLAVDLVHSAVARLFEGNAVAPTVRVVVLAVGDAAAQFDRLVSPLARLLDWLQAHYEILVLVSAGNHVGDLEISSEADTANSQELQHEVLCALQREAAFRRLLAPAESINALTIGACHEDATSVNQVEGRVDPLLSTDLPNVSSAVGSGVRRAVKPDVLLPGGRQLLTVEPHADGAPRRLSVPNTRRPPGVRVGAPGHQAGRVDATAFDTGTSVATGLAGHHAGHLLDALDELRTQLGDAVPAPEFDAVLVKAGIVHAARWGTAAGHIGPASEEVFAGRTRDAVARMVGYGRSSPSEVLLCDDHRVTVLAASRIGQDQADGYRFPLPPSLASVTERRRLTLTLAWLTPINPEHRAYRSAALIAEPNGLPKPLVDREDVDQYGARRGTVQHDVFEGRRAVPFAPDKAIELVVSCRAEANDLTAEVPYAIFVTLEVAEGVDLPIYQEVRQALQVPVPVPVRASYAHRPRAFTSVSRYERVSRSPGWLETVTRRLQSRPRWLH